MAKMNVTLKAPLKKGVFYWVTSVEAETEEEALVAAEHLFMEEVARVKSWEFTEYDVSIAAT